MKPTQAYSPPPKKKKILNTFELVPISDDLARIIYDGY